MFCFSQPQILFLKNFKALVKTYQVHTHKALAFRTLYQQNTFFAIIVYILYSVQQIYYNPTTRFPLNSPKHIQDQQITIQTIQ